MSATTKHTRLVAYRLPRDLLDHAELLAAVQGVSMTDLVTHALRRGLGKPAEPPAVTRSNITRMGGIPR